MVDVGRAGWSVPSCPVCVTYWFVIHMRGIWVCVMFGGCRSDRLVCPVMSSLCDILVCDPYERDMGVCNVWWMSVRPAGLSRHVQFAWRRCQRSALLANFSDKCVCCYWGFALLCFSFSFFCAFVLGFCVLFVFCMGVCCFVLFVCFFVIPPVTTGTIDGNYCSLL